MTVPSLTPAPNRSADNVDTDPTTRRAAACTGRTPSAAREAIARECGSSEDEDAREPDADQHERGTRSREHPFEWERDRGAHVATRVLELVEGCAPGVGTERQLEQPRRSDRSDANPRLKRSRSAGARPRMSATPTMASATGTARRTQPTSIPAISRSALPTTPDQSA